MSDQLLDLQILDEENDHKDAGRSLRAALGKQERGAGADAPPGSGREAGSASQAPTVETLMPGSTDYDPSRTTPTVRGSVPTPPGIGPRADAEGDTGSKSPRQTKSMSGHLQASQFSRYQRYIEENGFDACADEDDVQDRYRMLW